jgi:hypothetical protein
MATFITTSDKAKLLHEERVRICESNLSREEKYREFLKACTEILGVVEGVNLYTKFCKAGKVLLLTTK